MFDYGEPPESYPTELRAGYEAIIARAAALGEPWLSFFRPAELRMELSRLGFSDIDDLSPGDISLHFGFKREPNAPGGHFVRARRK